MSKEAERSPTFTSSPPPSGYNARDTDPVRHPTSYPPPASSALNGNGNGSTLSPLPARVRQNTIHPEDMEKLTEAYQNRAPDGVSPDQSINQIIDDLEAWATKITRAQKMETIRFWVLKGVSFFGVVGTTGFGATGMVRGAVAAGVITAIAIAVDAALPRSGDDSARSRAVVDLRDLQHTLRLKWEKVRLAHPDPTALKRVAHALALVDATTAKREKIGEYLGDASPAVRGAGVELGSV